MSSLTDALTSDSCPPDIALTIAERVGTLHTWSPRGGWRFSARRPGLLYASLRDCRFLDSSMEFASWYKRMGIVQEVVLHVCHERRVDGPLQQFGMVHHLTVREQEAVDRVRRFWDPVTVSVEMTCNASAHRPVWQTVVCNRGYLADRSPCPCCNLADLWPSYDRPAPDQQW